MDKAVIDTSGLRGGRKVPLKKTVDKAIEGLSLVESVLVARRTEAETAMQSGRDHWLDEECRRQRSTCTNEWMGSEDPLFIQQVGNGPRIKSEGGTVQDATSPPSKKGPASFPAGPKPCSDHPILTFQQRRQPWRPRAGQDRRSRGLPYRHTTGR